MDDLDALFDAPPPPVAVVDRSLMRVIGHLAPLIESVRAVLTDPTSTFALRLESATPAERAQIVHLRALLVALQAPIKLRLDALDAHARRAMDTLHADQLALPGGQAIMLEAGRVTYAVKEHELRAELLALAEAGTLTPEEVNEAVTEQVSYVVNHTRLNYLARHRGAAVEATINGHRTRVEPDATRARVRWPTPQGEK
jgi:hypothetical protein